MSTKVCKGCGWEFPITQKGNVCPICSTKFDTVVCHKCGEVVSGIDKVPGRALCKKCHNAEEREHMKTYLPKHYAKLEARFTEWLRDIDSIPKDYPTLTEAQWLEACRHFDGCARCHSSEIDTRGFFIGFEMGGRYCDWNIIPLCEKCAKVWLLNKNPFRIAEGRDRVQKSFEYRDCLEEIVEYLGGKLKNARNFKPNAK